MSQTRTSPALRKRTLLMYRRAVLIERAERLFVFSREATSENELRKAGEELHLISWELRELEKQLPNVARMI